MQLARAMSILSKSSNWQICIALAANIVGIIGICSGCVADDEYETSIDEAQISSAGTTTYRLDLEHYVETTSYSAKTNFKVWCHTCYWGFADVIGHGSVENVGSGTYRLIVCDDSADGKAVYIDRDGGSYGTSGNGTCNQVYASPYQWRVRWNGMVTPWFTMP